MRLSDLSSSTSARVELQHPVNGATGVWFTLLSRDAPEVQAVARKITDKRLASMRGRRDAKLTASDIETESLGLLVACITGWEGLEDLEYSPANAETLLREHAWIRRQIDEAIGDESLFFGA